MRRKDRQREEDFAWRVFDQAPYGVLSMRDGEGSYGVPVSPARVGEKVYFHCAMEGKKLDCLCQWPEASMALVTDVGPDYFAITFRSAVLRGRVTVVTDEDEKLAALRAISQRYCPEQMVDFAKYAAQAGRAARVCRLDVTEITGKERMT